MFQRMSEEPLTFCPSCGGKVKRLIGKGAGPIFKGSGFYQTDYKNSGPGKETGTKKETKPLPEKKADPPSAESKKDNNQKD